MLTPVPEQKRAVTQLRTLGCARIEKALLADKPRTLLLKQAQSKLHDLTVLHRNRHVDSRSERQDGLATG